jgi:hypothetical protein
MLEDTPAIAAIVEISCASIKLADAALVSETASMMVLSTIVMIVVLVVVVIVVDVVVSVVVVTVTFGSGFPPPEPPLWP